MAIRDMSRALTKGVVLWAMAGALSWQSEGAGEVSLWRFGAAEGHPWTEWTGLSILMDDFSSPGALQPRELKPDKSILAQIGPWQRWKFPIDVRYRAGQPRIWRGINYLIPSVNPPLVYVDGDPTTYNADTDFHHIYEEFYTLDLGGEVPAERFVFYPPEGADPFTGEPYRPNYSIRKFELSASRDEVRVVREEGSNYRPLDVVLSRVEQNFDPVVEVRFPLQYLRLFRLRAFPDDEKNGRQIISRLAYAEMEVYGQGFVPQATWESRVVDLGQEVNFGRVHFNVSRWRREGEASVPAPEAPVEVQVEVKTGYDDSPRAYLTFTDLGELVEVSEAEYEKLKARVYSWDPAAVGWRGPVVDDQDNWSFWAAPLRSSGQRPRVPAGRYFQVRVRLQTTGLWEYARLESLAVETSPLLAEEVVAEIAVADELQPEGNLVQVRAGEATQFVCDLEARFSSSAQSGFDAVRITAPAPAVFRRLEWREPLEPAVPDSVKAEQSGFTVYLPGRVSQEGVRRLRIWLEGVVYGASGEFGGEVFARTREDLPQGVEAGDAGTEVGTDQLRVVAQGLGAVLGAVEARPALFTPQGDGVNDRVLLGYTLFRVLEGVEVQIGVYTLAGERVRQLRLGPRGAGRHEAEWDGRDEAGHLVAPGLYLARVEVETDEGRFEHPRLIAVGY